VRHAAGGDVEHAAQRHMRRAHWRARGRHSRCDVGRRGRAAPRTASTRRDAAARCRAG
jgi:hypothetical protein